MNRVSAYIIAYNEEAKIADAVESVLWADDVIVVDSHSTDRTASIAEQLGARVVQLDFTGFGKLRNDAIAACSQPWIFSLDADERCTPEARDEILAIVNDKNAADAYYTPRRNWFMGRWINHSGWYPDYRQPQLFRAGALSFDERDEVHESFEVHGKIGHMQHAVLQIPFRNLEQVQNKSNRYSTLGADKLLRKGVQGSMAKALLHAIGAFLRIYILKLGFLDGWAGFVIAFGNFEGTFYRYAKLHEKQQRWDQPPKLP
ncbi:MAG TPA: glycosyltransferase family 2 protein [Mariprofundaceae bacterium]|nr:glycosyltransferase family 2 protein [Mariprofundaceae bacterium]